MTILDRIVADKRIEVEHAQQLHPIAELEQSSFFNRECFSLKNTILLPGASGIISEFKRQSPSKGVINGTVKVEDVTFGYQKAGASAISILTDSKYFGGTTADLIAARTNLTIPVLRKDFTISEYQIIEAKAIGADLILLIAASLEKEEILRFAQLAKSLGLEVLFEVHSEEELDKVNPYIDFVGVNNRNLKTFDVDINISKKLSSIIPNDFIKVSESGISNPASIKDLKSHGYSGFLIGENFMKTNNPQNELANFILEMGK